MTASASKLLSFSIRQHIDQRIRSMATAAWCSQTGRAILFVACLASFNATAVLAQASRGGQISGSVTEVKPGSISIKSTSGDTTTYLIQDKTDRGLVLNGRPTRFPGPISAVGNIPIKLVEQGMLIKAECKLNGSGRTESGIDSVLLLTDEKANPLQVQPAAIPKKKSEFVDTTIVGRVSSFKNSRLQLDVPKTDWFKRDRLSLKMNEQATLEIDDNSLARVVPGDEVEEANVFNFPNDVRAIRGIKVKLTGPRDALTTDFADQLQNKFSHLSDEPSEPRIKRSTHFALHTDISDRQAQVLLSKLETMYELVSGYYQARPRNPIECYVVRDLSQWPADQIPPAGRAKILEPAGVTMSSTSFSKGRSQTRAIVYSCDKHGVAQHEAVHAFCAQTFGSAGPTWYAEGMAEMGQYWKKGNLAVDISPYVANYLATAKPQKLKEIVNLDQTTGDSWQNYSWRWALCYMLASNPNYSKRFKQLGLNLMKQGKSRTPNSRKATDSFDAAFGPIADEISFEYDQFIENFGNGYRADLCVWDWKTKAKKLTGSRKVKTKVKAKAGWQATKALVAAGTTYSYESTGNWAFEPTGEVNADGSSGGQGRLVGVIFDDFKLSEPFELGVKGEFNAYSDGQLYVRCKDDWTSLSDNGGAIEFLLTKAKEN